MLPHAGAKRGAISRTACLPDGPQEEASRVQAEEEEEEALEVAAAAAAASARSQTAQVVLQLTGALLVLYWCVTGTKVRSGGGRSSSQRSLSSNGSGGASVNLRYWYKCTNTDAASVGSQTAQEVLRLLALLVPKYKY
jgi:hypothetical protein